MQMYPGYERPRDVLEEYAITFFSLLNEGYRQRNEKYLMLARIRLLTHASEQQLNDFMKRLEWAAKDPSDILKPSSEPATRDDLKRFFSRKF